MRFRNDGKGESNILQNKFTRYLMTAIGRKKADIKEKQDRIAKYEHFIDALDSFPEAAVESDFLCHPAFSMMFENIALERALNRLEERDRYILFMRVLEDREFSDLAAELGLKYKGVAAVYYRTIRKIREEMRGDEE